MNFIECYQNNKVILMEGAVGERLNREFSIYPDKHVALAGHIYNENSRLALKRIYSQYINIGVKYGHPLMLTTPTRRANQYCVGQSEYNKKESDLSDSSADALSL